MLTGQPDRRFTLDFPATWIPYNDCLHNASDNDPGMRVVVRQGQASLSVRLFTRLRRTSFRSVLRKNQMHSALVATSCLGYSEVMM
jgi:hypothetical protein